MVNMPLPLPCCRGAGQQSLLQAQCECSGDSEPSGRYQRQSPALTLGAGRYRYSDDANTVSRHCLPGQMSVSSLLQRLGVPASCEPLAFHLLLIPVLLCCLGPDCFGHKRI